MYLKCNRRKKDGKIHNYWSLVESQRLGPKKVVQKQVLYLGEINDSQKAAWRKVIDVVEKDGTGNQSLQMSLFSDEGPSPVDDHTAVQVRLRDLSVQRPRQYGACWLAQQLWNQLHLDPFWRGRLGVSRKGTDWTNVLKTLTTYCLLSGGSEWKLHRRWFAGTALADLLAEDDSLVAKDTLYRCLDKLVPYKDELFQHLQERWRTLFDAEFDVLLYDLTSTYFECDPPDEGKRRFGYSRDKRQDCVQVVIALIVTPQGFPLTYEVMPGNTKDSKTLSSFLEHIEKLYGKVNRTWIMDRGIPTEEVLKEMRATEVSYLVGTPKGKLTKLESDFAEKPWQEVREALKVKLHQQKDELYVLVESERRVCKERAMRRRRFRNLWKGLQELRGRKNLKLYTLLQKVGVLKAAAGRVQGLVKIRLPKPDEPIDDQTFHFEVNKQKMKEFRRKEGRYLLRSNLVSDDPAKLWSYYMVLMEIEQAFKELKHDLNVRPIYHQKDERIEAHIFVAFLAYCLNVTLKNRLKAKAPGLTPREVWAQLAEIQMVDVHLPTVDGRHIVLPRYTKPGQNHQLILHVLGLRLPKQPTPYLLETESKDSSRASDGDALLNRMGFGKEGPDPSEKGEKKTRGQRRFPYQTRSVKGQKRERRKICSGDLWGRPPVFTPIRPPRPP